jgi:hypothetical protein
MVALAGNAYMIEARTHLLMLTTSKHVTALDICHKGEHLRRVTKQLIAPQARRMLVTVANKVLMGTQSRQKLEVSEEHIAINHF